MIRSPNAHVPPHPHMSLLLLLLIQAFPDCCRAVEVAKRANALHISSAPAVANGTYLPSPAVASRAHSLMQTCPHHTLLPPQLSLSATLAILPPPLCSSQNVNHPSPATRMRDRLWCTSTHAAFGYCSAMPPMWYVWIETDGSPVSCPIFLPHTPSCVPGTDLCTSSTPGRPPYTLALVAAGTKCKPRPEYPPPFPSLCGSACGE